MNENDVDLSEEICFETVRQALSNCSEEARKEFVKQLEKVEGS